jgi:hypothetical protein
LLKINKKFDFLFIFSYNIYINKNGVIKKIMKPKNNKEIIDGSDSKFRSIKEYENNNGLYIDKTETIVREILKGLDKPGVVNNVSILGPRRFGKTLTTDVIEHIFNGDRELFEDTYLGNNQQEYNDKWWNDMSYPVIKIDFNLAGDSFGLDTESAAIIYTYENIYSQLLKVSNKFKLEKYILKIEKELEYLVEYKKKNEEKIKNSKIKLNPDYKNIRFMFDNIIEEVNNKHNNKGVVILVDEYDKVVTNFIDKPDLFNTIKNKLTDFYTVTKSNKNIKFLFLTGISRMGSNSLLSGMNHITDLTYTKEMSHLLGISEEELNKYFDLTQEEHDILKKWYNGYRFVEENQYTIDNINGNKIKRDNSVYCLFSTLKAIKNNKIKNYWISTAQPTMLLNYIKGMVKNGTLKEEFLKNLYDNEDFEGIEVPPSFLTSSINIESYDSDSLYALLLQTGYLTIKDYREDIDKFVLNYSNLEVKEAFKDMVKKYIYHVEIEIENSLKKLLKENNLSSLKEWFSKGFNKINYDILKKENMVEGNIHLFFHAALDGAGISNRQSLKTRNGESDLVIIDDKLDYNYLFEFKIKENWNSKLVDVKSNEDYEKYILGQCLEKGYVDAIFDNIYTDNPKNKEKELIVVPVIVSKKNGIEDIKFHLCDYENKELINIMHNNNGNVLGFEELKILYLASNKKEIEKELNDMVDLTNISKLKRKN